MFNEITITKMSKIKDKELSNLLIGRKGGITTIKITDQILQQPHNANQLSRILHLDYKTIFKCYFSILFKHLNNKIRFIIIVYRHIFFK